MKQVDEIFDYANDAPQPDSPRVVNFYQWPGIIPSLIDAARFYDRSFVIPV